MNCLATISRPTLYTALAFFLAMNVHASANGNLWSLMAVVFQATLLYALYTRVSWLRLALSAWCAIALFGCITSFTAALLRGAWTHSVYDLITTVVLFVVAALAWITRNHIISAQSAWPRATQK